MVQALKEAGIVCRNPSESEAIFNKNKIRGIDKEN